MAAIRGVVIVALLLVFGCRTVQEPWRAPLRIGLEGGEVVLDDRSLVYGVAFAGSGLPPEWDIETGSWNLTREGLVGSIDIEKAAVLWCRRSFPFDVAIRLWAEVLPPHDNDANVFFRAAGTTYGGGGAARGTRRYGFAVSRCTG